jgi:hypothetical protein
MYTFPTGIIIRYQLRTKFFSSSGMKHNARGAPEKIKDESVGCN